MLMYDPRFQFQTSDGLSIRYEIDDFTAPWEQAQTVVMLHAAMGSSRRFFAWVPPLLSRYRVVRWDMRGHGASGQRGSDPLSLDRLVRDLVEMLDHLELDRAHIVGSSAGGIVSLRAAIDHPDRFRTLSAFAAIPGLRSSIEHNDYEDWKAGLLREGITAFLKRTVRQRFRADLVDPGFVDWFIEDAARNDPRFLAEFVTMMTQIDFASELPAIRCPSLFVVPSNDPVHSMENYSVLEAVPDNRFIVYENMPHNITDAIPQRCVGDLLAFLDAHNAR
jgi:3-oxoadipate enol-lactonase